MTGPTGTAGHASAERTSAERDAGHAVWRAFLARWYRAYGQQCLTARQVWEAPALGMGRHPWDGRFPFPTGRPLAVSRGSRPVMSLGRWLAGQIDRHHGDVVLRSAREPHSKVRVYWVECARAVSANGGAGDPVASPGVGPGVTASGHGDGRGEPGTNPAGGRVGDAAGIASHTSGRHR